MALLAERNEIGGVVAEVAIQCPGFEVVDVSTLRSTAHEAGRAVAAADPLCYCGELRAS